MRFNLWTFCLENLDAAGAIAGYVSISIIGFALISLVAKKRIKNNTGNFKPKWTHPLIGSLMGAIPGCGATIIVATLYKNKKISFGGLLASFISTLGEGSFVLLGASNEVDISGNLKAFFIITLFGLITGFIFGIAFDIFGFKSEDKNQQETIIEDKHPYKIKHNNSIFFIKKMAFYSIIIMSIFLAPGSIMAFWGGGINVISNITYWVSIGLSCSCIIYFLINKFMYNHTDCSHNEDNFKSTLSHAINDVAMVVYYVFIGLFVANFIIEILVGPEKFNSWMTSSTYLIILLAAVIGAIPGCGGMIAVIVAFITIPDFPMAALIAAGIATSGDGIFALIAENKKDGLIISFIGLILALVIGYLALIFGF